MYGYRVLKKWSWSSASEDLLLNHATGSATDWKLRKLKPVRDEAKATLLKRQRFHCHYCRCPVEDNIGYLELDHLIPKDIAPLFTYCSLNLVVSCKRCNNAKGTTNPTRFDKDQLAVITSLPLGKHVYRWVQPYVHIYQDHIRIRSDYLYEGLKPIGVLVIKECKLHKVPGVLARRRQAAIKSSKDDSTAIFKLLGANPHLSEQELTEIFLLERKKPVSLHDKVLAQFINLRNSGKRVNAAIRVVKGI